MTTADPPKIIGTDNLTVVDYWKARAEELEADLLHEAQKCAALDAARLRAETEVEQFRKKIDQIRLDPECWYGTDKDRLKAWERHD